MAYDFGHAEKYTLILLISVRKGNVMAQSVDMGSAEKQP
jgi:hypothetical protein